MNDEEQLVLRGHILFPPGDLPKHAALVVVRVEDASRADAPATTIAEQRQERVALSHGHPLPFEIRIPVNLIEPGSRYVLRVHVDVAGTGSVTRGDLVSTRSHEVISGDGDTTATVEVRRVDP